MQVFYDYVEALAEVALTSGAQILGSPPARSAVCEAAMYSPTKCDRSGSGQTGLEL